MTGAAMPDPQAIAADVHRIIEQAEAARARIKREHSDWLANQPPAPPPPTQHELDRPLIESDLSAIEAGMRKIPARYTDAVPTDPAVLDWTDRTLAGEGGGLLLVGPVGAGKTWQAYGALRQIIASGCGVRIHASNVADLLDECRPGRHIADATGYGDTVTVDPVKSAETVGVLLLDDIGAFKASDWTAEVLYRILDARWCWCRPTIVTTNLAPADLKATLGDRLASRLAGSCRQVAVKGSDRRRSP